MPRVYHKRAAKDYPSIGVKKGEMYYSWAFRYGGKRKSKTPPRPSQLTMSKMSGAYAAAEGAEDTIKDAGSLEDIASALNEAAEGIREVAQEYQDSLDNMITQEGPIAEQIQESIDNLEGWAEQLESDASEVEGLDVSEHLDDTSEVEINGKMVKGGIVNGEKVDWSGAEGRPDPNDFDELTDDEKKAVLDAAREIAEANLSAPF